MTVTSNLSEIHQQQVGENIDFYHLQMKFGKVVFSQVSVCPGGLCPGGSLSRCVSVQGVAVQGVFVQGRLCSEGSRPMVSLFRVSLSKGVSVTETPVTVMFRRYASY